MQVKDGVNTTEFWLALAAKIATVILMLLGKLDPTVGAGLLTGTAVLYGAERTYLKGQGVKNGKAAANGTYNP